MKIIISGRNIELTPAIKDHVNEKFRRLEEHFDFIADIHVFLSVERNPKIKNNHKAEATVIVNGGVVRVEVASTDLYSSIDVLIRKLDRSLNKHKNKWGSRSKHDQTGESIRKPVVAGEDETHVVEEEAFEGTLHETTETVFITYDDVSAPAVGVS